MFKHLNTCIKNFNYTFLYEFHLTKTFTFIDNHAVKYVSIVVKSILLGEYLYVYFFFFSKIYPNTQIDNSYGFLTNRRRLRENVSLE